MCGDEITISDILIAPWFERMAVLEHYRDFKIPENDITLKWMKWSENVI